MDKQTLEMFKSLDTGIFDDSTGLRLLEYLTKDERPRAQPGAPPRSRKALFTKAQSENTVDEFTVRQIPDAAETTVLRNRPLTRNTQLDQDMSQRSSTFVRMPQWLLFSLCSSS